MLSATWWHLTVPATPKLGVGSTLAICLQGTTSNMLSAKALPGSIGSISQANEERGPN